MNNPDLYQIEDPHTNRSHKFELKETLEWKIQKNLNYIKLLLKEI